MVFTKLEKPVRLEFGEGSGTHSSILTWEIPWKEEPGGPQPIGSQEPDTT